MTTTGAEHVHVGKDGWLFLTSGSNNVTEQFNASDYMDFQIAAWRRIILARRAKLDAMGIVYRHVVVPEKLSIYDHKLDGLAIDARLSPTSRLLQFSASAFEPRSLLRRIRNALVLRRTCIDLVTPMRASRDGTDLYLRTDSHWSFAGRHLAYLAICRACRARPQPGLAERPLKTVTVVGDLGGAFDPPRTETVRVPDVQRDAVRRHASPIVEARETTGPIETLHTGAHVIYGNERPSDPRTVVLFGDSLSHFQPIMLTILLAETFAAVHFVWSASIDWSYVERVRPDIVLTEIAERFMYRVADDGFDLDAYVNGRFGEELAEAEPKA